MPSFRKKIWLSAALSVLAVIVVVFLLPEDLYLSSSLWDLGQFVSWRAFAADSIRAGHFPLWNPYSYSGQPFVGDFISAEFYPPNVLFLFLPLVRAFNLSLLLHLFLFGWGVGYWASRRGYLPAAAALAGLAAALSGPVWMRIPTGQVGNLATMAWAPWMFVALEAAWRGKSLRPLLLAAAAVCLQILGGHPQYAFYVAIAAGLHAVVHSVMDPSVRRRALPMLAMVYLAGAALASAQILPALAAAAESVRQGTLAYAFVQVSSFPPENFLTLIAPDFFGHLISANYWGRVFLWESCLFVGTSGLVLALLALVDRKCSRTARADWVVAALLLLLALGWHTPLLHVLYDYVPGFGKFRSLSKFTFPAALFVSLALAAGADALLRGRLANKFFCTGVALAGIAAVGAGIYLGQNPSSLSGLIHFVQQNHELYGPASPSADAAFIINAGADAGWTLARGGALLALVGGALFLAHRTPPLRYVPLGLLVVELLSFASAHFGTARPSDLVSPELKAFVAAHPGDYRVLDPVFKDCGYLLGASDLSGDDPTVLKRYAEFIAFTQGANPDLATQYTTFVNLPQLFSLLRFKYAFLPNVDNPQSYQTAYNPNPLPRALLVSQAQVLPGRDAIFAELHKPGFDPRQTVLLEKEPSPAPQAGVPVGAIKIADSTTDSLTLEADTPAPALLLITDLYSRDWRALPLAGSTQTDYEILPADYILRAIPLQAGHHHLIVEYAPPSLRQGLIISALAWLIWLGLAIKSFTLRPVN